MSEQQQQLSCRVICYAEKLDLPTLMKTLFSMGRGAYYRNVLYLELGNGSCIIFSFGVIVYWNLEDNIIDKISEKVLINADGIHSDPECDYFFYKVGCEKNRFTHEHIELMDSEPFTLLAISHALSQSVKLSAYETQAQKTIEQTSEIPRKLARTGSTSLSRKQAAMMRGELFLTKSEILLKYELLDTPEFFWEFPELQSIYEVGASYLEIKQRTEILSLKLGTIHELFEMLADDLKHQHSSKLEWIIIWLIAVEIVIFLVNDVILAN